MLLDWEGDPEGIQTAGELGLDDWGWPWITVQIEPSDNDMWTVWFYGWNDFEDILDLGCYTTSARAKVAAESAWATLFEDEGPLVGVDDLGAITLVEKTTAVVTRRIETPEEVKAFVA